MDIEQGNIRVDTAGLRNRFFRRPEPKAEKEPTSLDARYSQRERIDAKALVARYLDDKSEKITTQLSKTQVVKSESTQSTSEQRFTWVEETKNVVRFIEKEESARIAIRDQIA